MVSRWSVDGFFLCNLFNISLMVCVSSTCFILPHRTLVVDEISMIDGELFEKMEDLAKQVRKNKMPFGGIQLILCG